MIRYLLDTNICIYLIKKRPKEVLAKFREHSPEEVAISTVTLFELQYGIEKSRFRERSRKALTKFLLPLNILELDQTAAKEAAIIRSQLEMKGIPIGSYDLLIAGIARSHDLILVTNNMKEFGRIDNLKLDNWVLGEG